MTWKRTSETRIETLGYSITKMKTQNGMLYSAFRVSGETPLFLGCGIYAGPDDMKFLCEKDAETLRKKL